MFSVVVGQCSEAMKIKLESEDEREQFDKDRDLAKLLKYLKVWMHNQQRNRNPIVSIFDAMDAMF